MANDEDDLFPLRVLREGDELPPEPVAFVVGKNGIFVKRERTCYRAVVATNELPMLVPVQEGAEYLLPPMPAERVMQILLFFRAVYEREKSEAILIISYHARRGTFRLEAPEQRVTSGHINYDMPPVTEGFEFVGTVHSHGSMSAFHSSMDTHDEEKFDGIHITFGHVGERLVDIVATLAVNGKRFTQDVERVLGGTRKINNFTPGEFKPFQPIQQLPEAPPVPPNFTDAAVNDVQRVERQHIVSDYYTRRDMYFKRFTSIGLNDHLPYASSGGTWTPAIREEGYLVEVPEEIVPEEYHPPIAWSAAVHPDGGTYNSYSVSTPGWRAESYADAWDRHHAAGHPPVPAIQSRGLDRHEADEVRNAGEEPSKPIRCGWRDPEEEDG